MGKVEIKIPAVGESITEVTLGSWLKNEGDRVKVDDVICNLDSDKATFEITAEVDGILHQNAKEGGTLAVGAVVATIETEAAAQANAAPTPASGQEEAQSSAQEKSAANEVESASQESATTKEPVAAQAPAPSPPDTITHQTTASIVEMRVPTVGESITEVTVASWNKKDGDQVEVDEILCELESDKATFELPSEGKGILRIAAQEGETIPVGDVICRIEVSDAQPQTSAAPANTPATEPAAPAPSNLASGDKQTSPVAAKILAEKGINPGEINGTGSRGKITKEDALKATRDPQPSDSVPAQEVKMTPTPQEITKPQEASKPVSGNRSQRSEKISSLRKTIARRLVAVKNETAMLTTFNEVDMKPVMEFRTKYKDKFKEKYEVGLGFMSFFAKAACQALKEFPTINAYMDGDNITYNDYVDISMAVSTPKGLVVPVIRDVEGLSFAEIEKEIIRLANKARDGKLSIEEMTGGTFTITNGGVFGSMMSTPIINSPQSAILGMHNILERPVVIDGQIVARPMMYVALSYDHRIIDGKESVSFLVRIKQLIEDPMRLLLDI